MKDNIALLAQYKEEKAMVIGSVEERTGLEDYPHFKEWKAEYVAEYEDTHLMVDEEEADEMAELLISEADQSAEMLIIQAELLANAVEQAEDEAEDEAEEAPAATSKPKAKAKPRKPTAKKKTAQKANKTVSAPKKTRTPRSKSKTAKAQAIFDKHFNKKTRKEIIAMFAKIGLTPAGSSTYYQKFRKAAGA